jgi:DNA-3-methyladenine glycosylase II
MTSSLSSISDAAHASVNCSAHEFLANVDADWASHVANMGPVRLESRPAREPYEALTRAIAYQQLHAKAGDAILERVRRLFPAQRFPTPADIMATSDASLRACGLSGAKAASIRGLARATLDGVVPSLRAAKTMSDDALIERLVPLRGVGRWTVEMFLIYSLDRADVLPADDFGVRDGYRRLKSLPTAPAPRQMREQGQAWTPFRTAATWYLWRASSRGQEFERKNRSASR